MKLIIDNILTISLVNNPISHEMSEYIETRFHFIREEVKKGMLEVIFCPIEVQLANGFPTSLKIDKFVYV